MCGIAGIVRDRPGAPVEEGALLRMARSILHRGPDGFGFARDRGAGFVSTRLAIVDLPHGWQPLEAHSGDLLVYNGEVYNHPELRAELDADGVELANDSDTEVVFRLLERDGLDALSRLNGQFALAWWQAADRRLTLARDRFGVRPLHYSLREDGSIVFASEAKALFASGEVAAEPDLRGIDDVFTTWGPRAPITPFKGVSQVEPGGLLSWQEGRVDTRRWWSPEYGKGREDDPGQLAELMRDAVRLRLRADVPVGAYLSGGLDSSLISALAREQIGANLQTFSVAFADPVFDERGFQETVAAALGTQHHVLDIGPGDIAAGLPLAVRHAEAPTIRTAPVPLSLLAEEVRRQGITVVLTGEGADEVFWGYDLFKEVVVRELHDSEPQRAVEMLEGLYPYLGADGARRGPAWQRFLLETGEPGDPLRSHMTRIAATATARAFYRPEVAEALDADASVARLRRALPEGFDDWSALERAAWLEVSTLLGPYLLATQGDRVGMAHGVEGRFPFLDHRIFEYAAALPPERKLSGTEDKVALREVAAELLPEEVSRRPKQPYRAPEIAPFFSEDAPEWVGELLSPGGLDEAGIFDADRVAGLVRRCEAGKATGIRESMALVGILSTGLWHRELIGTGSYPEETAQPRVRIDRGETTETEEVA